MGCGVSEAASDVLQGHPLRSLEVDRRHDPRLPSARRRLSSTPLPRYPPHTLEKRTAHLLTPRYLIIFGTGTGTEGHSGRHTADDHFHILKGTQRAYPAGALEGEVYRQGDVHWMHRGVVKQYMMEPNSWALEYAAGWIPPMLPFGFFDAMFSTLDVVTVWHTVRITGREMIANLLRGKI